MASQIKTFSSKGSATTDRRGGSGSPGFRQDNGQVYVRPRARLDQISGGRVRVTNPKSLSHRTARRSRGIGMGANNDNFQNLST